MRSRRPPPLDKLFLGPQKLLIHQVVGLVNEANGNVGNDLWRTALHKIAIDLERLGCFASEFTNVERFL